MGRQIRRNVILALVAAAGCSLSSCSKPNNPEMEFKELFNDLSIGVPQYQSLSNFVHPADVIKGDYCDVRFTQTESQFRVFANRLGMSPEKIISSTNIWIKADSKINPKYSWMLNVEVHISSSATNFYEVHIDGRQPYD